MTHVTKQTAVLLKEKGFDLPCEWVYAYKTKALKSYELSKGVLTNHNLKGNMLISAPDIYAACIWLREAKGVHVYVTCTDSEWHFSIENTNGVSLFNSTILSVTHDLAIEAGIIYALKNIM